jgi:hypothetical protein
MSNGYSFYIQKYPQGDREFNAIDFESLYNCLYASMTNITEFGKIKNVYTETFAESEKARLYVPSSDLLVHETTDCTLTVLFKGDDALKNSLDFYDYIAGQVIEYHDTFRNLYVTLLLTEAPTKGEEHLYKGTKYRQMKYKFTNICGRAFTTSQISNADKIFYLLTEAGYKFRLEDRSGDIALEQ